MTNEDTQQVLSSGIEETPALGWHEVQEAEAPAIFADSSLQSSAGIAKLVAALAATQKALEDPKKTAVARIPTRKGSVREFSYAPLAEITAVIRAAMAGTGLTITQWLTSCQPEIRLVTLLAHDSGEYIRSTLVVTPPQSERMDPMAQIAANVTSIRKMTLLSALGLSTEDPYFEQETGKPHRTPKAISAKDAEALIGTICRAGLPLERVETWMQKNWPNDYDVETGTIRNLQRKHLAEMHDHLPHFAAALARERGYDAAIAEAIGVARVLYGWDGGKETLPDVIREMQRKAAQQREAAQRREGLIDADENKKADALLAMAELLAQIKPDEDVLTALELELAEGIKERLESKPN